MKTQYKKRTQQEEKLHIVYLPFLAVSLGSMIISSIAFIVFNVKMGLIKDGSFYTFFIALLAITLFLILRKRSRILFRERDEEGDYDIDYNFIFIAATIVPIIFLGFHLEKKMFKLQVIDNIEQAANMPREKYFKIKSAPIDTLSRIAIINEK